MDELKIEFTYNGEKSLFNFLNYIKHNLRDNKFDKHYWSGNIKIDNKNFKEEKKDFAYILFKILFA